MLCSCLVLHRQPFVLTRPMYILAKLHNVWTKEWASYDQTMSCNNASCWSCLPSCFRFSHLADVSQFHFTSLPKLNFLHFPLSHPIQAQQHVLASALLPSLKDHFLPSPLGWMAWLSQAATTHCRMQLAGSSWDSVQLWWTLIRQSETKHELYPITVYSC